MVTAHRLLTTHSRPASPRLQVGDVQDNYITCWNWPTPTTISYTAFPRYKAETMPGCPALDAVKILVTNSWLGCRIQEENGQRGIGSIQTTRCVNWQGIRAPTTDGSHKLVSTCITSTKAAYNPWFISIYWSSNLLYHCTNIRFITRI